MLRAILGLTFWLSMYAGAAYAAYAYWFVPKFVPTTASVTPRAEHIQSVRVVTAKLADHTIYRTLQAEVVARKKDAFNFRAAGCIDQVFMDLQPGDPLEKGTVLATLNDAQARLAVAESEAKIMQFTARINEANVALNIQKGISQRSETLLEEERVRYDRQKNLFSKNLLTQGALDTAERSLSEAEQVRANSAEAKLLSQAQLDRLTTELRVLEGQLEQSRITLSDMSLQSPATVRVLESRLRVGDCVTPTTDLIDTYDPDSLEINAEVPTLFTAQVAQGVSLQGMPVVLSPPYQGCNTQVTDVDTLGKDANTQVLRIALPATCNRALTFNQRLSLRIPGETLQDVLRLPKAAEQDDGAVFVVTDDRLRRKAVDIAARDARWIYVNSGLAPDDRVLTSDTDLAVEGLAVQVISP